MRYLVGFILFLQSFVILAQTSQSKSIDYQEKQRLENEFKALGDYYIDDSGLVVYRTNSINTGSTNNNKKFNSDNRVSTTQQKTPDTSIRKRDSQQPNTVVASEKKYQQPSKSNTANTKAPVYIKSDKPSQTTPIIVDRTTPRTGDLDSNTMTDTKTKIEDNSKSTSTNRKGSVLNRTRQPQYKNLEEAALAVEALIDDLKKEQTSYTNSGSMSSRLSRGVTKDLRKQSERNIQQVYTPNNSAYEVKTVEEANDFGNEPSYFINGVQVEKIEVNKLRQSDIINREIRVRNTVTGNPNGEIWYEVKEAQY